jgi:aspartyl-tRNA(Asn)/glutamyl-tRNA(Gln) amidotransferase subunit A
VTPTPAFKLGEKTDDPVQMYLEDIYSVAASLAGICGVSVPCGTTQDGLPIGVQVMGKHFDEATMLRVAQAVEAGQMSGSMRQDAKVVGEAQQVP